MKAYPHLIQKLFFAPLVVLPSTYGTFEQALLRTMGLPFDASYADPHARGPRAHEFYEDDEDGGDRARRVETPGQRQQRRVNQIMQTYGDVAVISIDGVIDKRLSDFEMDCYGGVDLSDVDAAIVQVGQDPRISRVVFDINSPGGSAAGVAETANRIRKLGDYKSNGGAAKETHARVELLCASGAQWLASQCDVITACPSATLGSVGVYSAMLDQTGWLEQNGLKVQLIKAGKYKAMGASFKSLTDEETAMIQARVDELWSEFKAAVRVSRDVAESTLQGQTFTAAEAKKLGLADKVDPSSLDEYVAALL